MVQHRVVVVGCVASAASIGLLDMIELKIIKVKVEINAFYLRLERPDTYVLAPSAVKRNRPRYEVQPC